MSDVNKTLTGKISSPSHVELSPPQTPQLSSSSNPPQSPLQSWSHVELLLFGLASHTPQSSVIDRPLITPAQSWHEELSPLQTPHKSNSDVPFQMPSQSWIHVELSLLASLSHIPQSSVVAVPFKVPAQS